MAGLMSCRVEHGAQACRGSIRFGVGQNRRDDSYARATRAQHAVQVVDADATNGQHWHVDGLHDFGELGQTAWR
jgi:hypothetical protein